MAKNYRPRGEENVFSVGNKNNVIYRRSIRRPYRTISLRASSSSGCSILYKPS
ncbi:hypothetical protein KC19_2G175500 [Ceratodon purpureus]|uniref:Uncharacterized protein n=1 Tax=Ceratodon purpureus TaxID=3225 RepID=A0A8T0IXV7_CERPU|nr:hypothetical protein KC19_2G175500 [Ceratodon purpureus]